MARKPLNVPNTKPLRRHYLSNLRCKLNMSQKDVATACNIETFVYCQIESGKRGALMNALKIIDLANAFHVGIEEFCRMEADYLTKRKERLEEERAINYGHQQRGIY